MIPSVDSDFMSSLFSFAQQFRHSVPGSGVGIDIDFECNGFFGHVPLFSSLIALRAQFNSYAGDVNIKSLFDDFSTA
jgi:hypothetical protein